MRALVKNLLHNTPKPLALRVSFQSSNRIRLEGEFPEGTFRNPAELRKHLEYYGAADGGLAVKQTALVKGNPDSFAVEGLQGAAQDYDLLLDELRKKCSLVHEETSFAVPKSQFPDITKINSRLKGWVPSHSQSIIERLRGLSRSPPQPRAYNIRKVTESGSRWVFTISRGEFGGDFDDALSAVIARLGKEAEYAGASHSAKPL